MRCDTLDYFLHGGWQKKSPATEVERTYLAGNKGNNNLPNNQISYAENLEDVWDELRDELFAPERYPLKSIVPEEPTGEEVAPPPQDDGEGKTPIGSPCGLGEDSLALGVIAPPEDSPSALNQPMLKSLHHAPELPIWGLPRFFQDYCENVTETYQCPREFVVGAMFSVISTAVGNRVLISTPKYKKKNMSLWIATVAPSGSNKSEPVEEVMRPLIKIDDCLVDEYKGDDEQLPTRKAVLLGKDVTPEARTEAMANNPQGMCQYADEVSTIFLNQNRYNQNAGVIDLLDVYDGRRLRSDRKSKDNSFLIKKPFLNILGNIQPEYIKDIFGEKRYIASGFNARWIFLFPEEVSFEPLNDAVCDQHLSEQWDWAINALQTIVEGQELNVEGDAYDIYWHYHAELQRKKERGDSYERSIYAKLQIQVLRLAGVVHNMNVLANARFSGDTMLYDDLHVTPEEMRYAIDCMEYFEHTAKKVMDIVKAGASVMDGSNLNKKQLIKLMFKRFTIPNKQAFADAISVSRPYVSGIINEK